MRRRLRYIYLRFIRLRATPAALARGFAIGIFSGMFPFFGAQIVLAVLVAIAFRGNKIMAAAGTWVSNPLTYVPIYTFNFYVGSALLRQPATMLQLDGAQSVSELLKASTDLAATLLLGCLVVATVSSIAAYFGMLIVARRLKRR